MTGWLFDTDVLSALAPGRPALSAGAVAWFEEKNEELFFSAITIMEINSGIAKLERIGATARAGRMRAWFGGIVGQYGDRLLPFDAPAAEIAGRLSDAATARGRHPGFADIAIGAIAKSRELVVLTANLRHFEPLDIDAYNPLDL